MGNNSVRKLELILTLPNGWGIDGGTRTTLSFRRQDPPILKCPFNDKKNFWKICEKLGNVISLSRN